MDFVDCVDRISLKWGESGGMGRGAGAACAGRERECTVQLEMCELRDCLFFLSALRCIFFLFLSSLCINQPHFQATHGYRPLDTLDPSLHSPTSLTHTPPHTMRVAEVKSSKEQRIATHSHIKACPLLSKSLFFSLFLHSCARPNTSLLSPLPDYRLTSPISIYSILLLCNNRVLDSGTMDPQNPSLLDSLVRNRRVR